MLVSQILKDKGDLVFTASPNDTVAKAAGLLYERKVGAMVVVDADGSVVGILSERDIVGGVYSHGPAVGELGVADLMTRDVVICTPDDTIETIMNGMTQRRVRHLPVMDEAQLVGIVSIGDIVKHRLELSEMEVSSLRQYVMEAR